MDTCKCTSRTDMHLQTTFISFESFLQPFKNGQVSITSHSLNSPAGDRSLQQMTTSDTKKTHAISLPVARYSLNNPQWLEKRLEQTGKPFCLYQTPFKIICPNPFIQQINLVSYPFHIISKVIMRK